MAKYKVKEPCKVQTTTTLFGSLDATFKRGTVEPKNEQEELLLGLAVNAGVATAAKADEKED